MFRYFVHIVIFFKLLSCIDIKLEFNAKLVFMVLLNFLMWFFGPL
jgi:hypothetical protein